MSSTTEPRRRGAEEQSGLSLVLEGIEGRCRGAVRGPEMCDESRSDTTMCSRGTYWNWKNLLYRGIHPSDGTRRQIIVLDGSEVEEGSDNPQDARTGSDNSRAARQGTRSTRQGSDNPGADTLRASRQGSDNPLGARTGSDNPGSDNPRAARHGTIAVVQGSDNPGTDTPHASR
jgi:hypothetical protein